MDFSKRIKISRRHVLKMGAVGYAVLSLGIFPDSLVKSKTGSDTPEQPEQLGFMYDQQKCVGCRICQASCKATYNWEEGTEWRRVLTSERPKVWLSLSCNHCENPACLTVCPVGAYTKREKDGIVIQDSEKCIGCKYCMYACPYHAPQFSDDTGRISKCHFCYERQDKGEDPVCVANCPTNALTYGKLTELRETQGGVDYLEGLPDPELTRPSWVIIPKVKGDE